MSFHCTKWGIKVVENYRPISMLCVVAKVLKGCIFHRQVDYIQKMTTGQQHDLMRGKSCSDQLLSVLDRIGKNLDTVDHKLLLQKLTPSTIVSSKEIFLTGSLTIR